MLKKIASVWLQTTPKCFRGGIMQCFWMRLHCQELRSILIAQRILRVLFAWMKRKPKIYLSLKLDHRSDIFHLRGCLDTQIDGWCTTDPQEHKILHKNKNMSNCVCWLFLMSIWKRPIGSLGCQDRGNYLNLFRERGGR